MNGKVKTILLVLLLVIVAGTAFYKVEQNDKAKAKAAAEQQAKLQAEEAAKKAETPKYVAPQQQVVGATTYSDNELINIANENYAQFMHNSNTYNFENVISKEQNGNNLTATFNATCNGQPQTITVQFAQVNNVVSIVGQ
ncbi:MAG: hypothetical protein ACRC57_06415 [Sarcina sp.]